MSTEIDREAPADTVDEQIDRLRARLLETADWETLTRDLTEFATRRDWGADPSKTGADYANEAIAIVRFERPRSWDPTVQPDLYRHLQSVVNGLIRNVATSMQERLRARPQRGKAAEKKLPSVRSVASLERSPEENAAMKDLFERLADRVAIRFGDKAVAYMRMATDSPDEQAAALGVPKEQIYRIREYVRAYCEKIRGEMGVGKTILARRVPDPQLDALEAAIRDLLPEHLRHERGAPRFGTFTSSRKILLIPAVVLLVDLVIWLVRHH